MPDLITVSRLASALRGNIESAFRVTSNGVVTKLIVEVTQSIGEDVWPTLLKPGRSVIRTLIETRRLETMLILRRKSRVEL